MLRVVPPVGKGCTLYHVSSKSRPERSSASSTLRKRLSSPLPRTDGSRKAFLAAVAASLISSDGDPGVISMSPSRSTVPWAPFTWNATLSTS